MQYTNLGRTGLKVSRLCLGTMNFGPQTTEPDSFAIMDRALETGINFFDTADVYGHGHSEEVLGAALAGIRSEVILATKVGGNFYNRDVTPLRARVATIAALDATVPEIDACPVIPRLSSEPRTKPRMTSSGVMRAIRRLFPRRTMAKPVR